MSLLEEGGLVVVVVEEEESLLGLGTVGFMRSPWRMQSCWITHLPARMMWRGPRMEARREILLPVSVSMYSERELALGGIVERVREETAEAGSQSSDRQ